MIIDPYTWNQVIIKSIKTVADSTVVVRMERPKGYIFKAGQYSVARITLKNGEQRIRQYSYSSSPLEPNTLEMLIQHEPNGEVSSWFCKYAKVGDSIEISQALGGFVLNDSTRPTLLIAGKVGVAPYLSMLREGAHSNLSLVYSVRNKNQICFPSELETYNSTVVETSKTSRISIDLLGPHLSSNPIVYICGSKQFVYAVTETVVSGGVPIVDVYRELFTLQ